MRIFGVILAGGEGRRMGGADKALLPLGGVSMIARVRARLEPQVEALAISANGDPARFRGTVLPDDDPQGPLSGVLAGLRWAAGLGADAVVTAPVDVPFLPGDLVPMLCLRWPGAALARAGGRLHPACALWPVTAAPSLEAWLASGQRRVGDFAASIGATPVDFPDPREFLNLNTPEDLAAAQALL
ncbi:molybdenum cofactor guanylyltransferase MobA [Cereibacter sp. SYSU M97828]|nr:molybdenum cofactor guanylyltransferase MobA [Cereibacter flavus]